MNTVGTLIKLELKSLGIKQSAVAKQLKISRSTLSGMLGRELKLNEFFNICLAAQLDVNCVFKKYCSQLIESEVEA